MRPAIVGTVSGALAVGALLVLVGARPDVYAAITPPIMVIAFAAGAVIGPTWGQALFTVLVTLVFTQLTPVGTEIVGVRVVDVLVGAATGIATGLLTWPRGAAGELRRSAAGFLVVGGRSVRIAADMLTNPPAKTDAWAAARPGIADAMTLADATYVLNLNENLNQRRQPAEPAVDWPAVITAGHHMVRGSELLLDTYAPGSLEPWRSWVTDSAAKVDAACRGVADALHERRPPRIARLVLDPLPGNIRDLDAAQAWLTEIADNLTALSAEGGQSRR